MQEDLVYDLNNLEILNKISEGANNIVFQVKDKRTGNQFACKINKTKIDDINMQNLFVKDIYTISKIKYLNIINIFGYNLFNFDNQPFPSIITEYFPNGCLDQILNNLTNSMNPSEWTDTKKYITLIGISLAMNHLHSNHIVHGNLKPTNILFNKKYYPIISDLYLPDIRMNTISKNSPYISPEILLQEEPTEKSDVYSFGIIAYEIITNKRSPIEISNFQDAQIIDIFTSLTSKDPSKRLTFSQICEYLCFSDFIELFENIDYSEVIDYLDEFEEESIELITLRSFMLKLRQKEGDKQEMIRYYQKGIEKGSTLLMTDYAYMLEQGEILDQNKEEAVRYYKMAIEKGNFYAMYFYAHMLENSEDFPSNKEEVIRYYKMAIDKGNSTAMYFYADMLQNSEDFPSNKEEVIHYYKMAIDKGDSTAMYKYANMLENSEDFPSNKEEVIRYYKMAIEKGNFYAMNSYAKMLLHGIGVDKNYKEAARYFKMSANLGNSYAIEEYVGMLKRGKAVESDKKEEARYYKMAADNGDVESMKIYADEILETNKEESIQYYKMAIEEGDTDSMNSYAFILQHSNEFPSNKDEVIRLYKMAIDNFNFNKNAMYNYAYILWNYDDEIECFDINNNTKQDNSDLQYQIRIEKDTDNNLLKYSIMKNHSDDQNQHKKDEAAKYFKKSAKLGNKKAILFYANLLRNGDHVSIDKKKASKYYKKLANKGNKEAMICYATMLEKGEGIPIDINEANRLYKMAEDKNDE